LSGSDRADCALRTLHEEKGLDGNRFRRGRHFSFTGWVLLGRRAPVQPQHPADEAYEVDLGAPVSHLRAPPLTARLDRDEDIAGAGASARDNCRRLT
jgi:hypothetical protein